MFATLFGGGCDGRADVSGCVSSMQQRWQDATQLKFGLNKIVPQLLQPGRRVRRTQHEPGKVFQNSKAFTSTVEVRIQQRRNSIDHVCNC